MAPEQPAPAETSPPSGPAAEPASPAPDRPETAIPGDHAPEPDPHDYRVQLDAYAGPLDLLLYLVRRHEIDLHDIPIAQLTDQYLAHLSVIQSLGRFDMERAGEFLVMAATLLEIKSQMLVPRPEGEGAGEDEPDAAEPFDPRADLVQQLLAYRRYKTAALELERRGDAWARRHPATAATGKPAADPDHAPPAELDLEDVQVLDLCAAFARVLDAIGQPRHHAVTYDDTPISLHAEDIHDRLRRDGAMTLAKLFEGRAHRSELIGLFLATLELVRQRAVRVVQDPAGGEITLEPTGQDPADAPADAADPDAAADWRDPETGEMQYDWPDEDARRRSQRRARLRAARRAQGRFDDLEEDDDTEAEDDGIEDDTSDGIEDDLSDDEPDPDEGDGPRP